MPFPYQENFAARIDLVLFDYGMVLSGPPDPAAWAILRSVTGLDEDRLHAGYWKFRHDYDRGALTGPAYWQAVAADTGVTLDDAQVARLIIADVDLWTVPNPPMIEWAARLQRAGVRTGILSNIGDCMAEGIVAKLPWLARFDHCIWSHALFLAKPDPAIFLKTAEIFSTPPASILFLDDKHENIDAARATGMQAIQYGSHADFEHAMIARGFASLLDVPALQPAAK